MTLEEEFNQIINKTYYGPISGKQSERSIFGSPGPIITEAWSAYNGPGFGTEMYKKQVDDHYSHLRKSLFHSAMPALCALIDSNPTLALTSSDLFIREFAQAYMEDKK